jgi:pyruvate dehydrogenase E2 component (dihydrolipoamide acetyltransferase)
MTRLIAATAALVLTIGSSSSMAYLKLGAMVNGQVVVRQKMRMTMSCDHRAIDGATGAAFLKTLKTLLENPLALVW